MRCACSTIWNSVPSSLKCANCGSEILAEDQFFSIPWRRTGLSNCGQGLPNLTPISVDTLEYLRHFQRSSYAGAAGARPRRRSGSETESLMQGYFTYLLEGELNTPGFIRQASTAYEYPRLPGSSTGIRLPQFKTNTQDARRMNQPMPLQKKS